MYQRFTIQDNPEHFCCKHVEIQTVQFTNINEYVRIYSAKPRNSFGGMLSKLGKIYFRSKN